MRGIVACAVLSVLGSRVSLAGCAAGTSGFGVVWGGASVGTGLRDLRLATERRSENSSSLLSLSTSARRLNRRPLVNSDTAKSRKVVAEKSATVHSSSLSSSSSPALLALRFFGAVSLVPSLSS